MKLLFNLIIFKSHKFFFYNSEMTHGYSTLCVEGNWEEERGEDMKPHKTLLFLYACLARRRNYIIEKDVTQTIDFL